MIHAAYSVCMPVHLVLRALQRRNIPERLVLCTALHR